MSRRRPLGPQAARGLASPAGAAAAVTVARTQAAGVESAAPQVTGWQLYGANAPRIAAGGLLIETARTNLMPNARTPGSTSWTNTGIASAVAAVGPDGTNSAFLVTENTATSLHNTFRGSLTVTSGLRYVASVFVAPGTASFVQLAFGTTGFGTTQFANFSLTGAGSVTLQGAGLVSAGIERFGDFYRIHIIADATASIAGAGVNIGFIQTGTDARAPSFAGTSRTLRLAWVQLEVGAFLTSPILPPVGAPAEATRGADVVSAPLALLGISDSGAGIYEGTATLAVSAGAAAQSLVEIDDGSTSNRFIVRNAASGSAIALNRVTGGAAAGDVSAGNMTPGVPFRWRLRVPGDGSAHLSLNGGAEVSVTGGPVQNLTTVRVGDSQAGTTPMAGVLRLSAVPSLSADVVPVPSGFTWTPPFRIFRSGVGVYGTDFSASSYVITGKAYYVSPRGRDANDGLSWAAPKRSIANVLATVADYDVIYVEAGEYDASTGWNGQTMTRSASVIAVGGRAVFSRRVPRFTWAADSNPGVWLGTPSSATAIGLVVDAAYPGATGLPMRLIRVTDLAACAATPGSFFATGTQVYVHLIDARAPDASVIGYFTGVNGRINNAVNAYFEGLDFVGGDDAFVTSGAPVARTVVFNGCTFRFASNGDGLDANTGGTFILAGCIAEMNELDGLNYGVSTDNVTGSNMVEIGCTARWNGYTASGFNNGSTQHLGCVGVSVNCLFENNQNRNVHDVFTNCQRWALGCASRNSRDTGAGGVNWAVGQIPAQSGAGQAVSMWLDGCVSYGSTTDFEINAAGTLRTRNMNTGGLVITNIGTLGTY